jgi:hypothetical protein
MITPVGIEVTFARCFAEKEGESEVRVLPNREENVWPRGRGAESGSWEASPLNLVGSQPRTFP